MTLWFRFVRTVSFKVFLVNILSLQIAGLGTTARAQISASAHPQFAKLLADPLPGHPKSPAEPSFFKPDTLYQYIDGRTDVYLLYDFLPLLPQNFKVGTADLTA